MELPIPYEQRDALWPQLSILQDLSFAARTVFVRAATYAKADFAGLVECSRIGLNGLSELESGLDELAAVGLVTPEVAVSDLLRLVSLKDLKQFAFRHGLESHGYKYQLIENITKHGAEKEALALLQAEDAQRYVKVMIHESDLLRKHVRAEEGRFYWYLEWIARVQWLGLPIREVAAFLPQRDNNLDPWIPWPEKAQAYLQDSWTQPEIRLIRSIWNDECDRIVEALARKYGWAADALISNAIRSYLPPDQLRAFREAQVWHAWQNVFTYYGCARIVEMGIEVREPKVMSCAGCGSWFRESSVYSDLAQRVDYKIHFCCGCYEKALNGVDRDKDPQPPATMLVGLKTLATTLAVVPTASFLQRTDLATLSDDKQIAVVKCLLAMPSYKRYVKVFGSWFKALVLAGVLEGGAQPLSRGTRCFADDGHVCLSLSEKAIDDWLNAHGICHEKEPLYPRHPDLNPTGRIRSDWRVGRTIIEYVGLLDEPDYFARIEAKRELARESGISLIVVEPRHILSN
jgi:hypothetical protein